MTTRKITLVSVGTAALLMFAAPALAGDWGFSFGFGFGYGGRCYRAAYFPRTYVYREYCAPTVVYRDCYPDVVACEPAPVVTYFRGSCAPRVVYRDYAPRYVVGGTYAVRGYYPAYRAYRPAYVSFGAYSHRPVYHGRGYHR